MAKLILHSIGTDLEKALDPAEATKNADYLAGLEAALGSKRDEIRAGWGEKYVGRIHAKGKLTTWDRNDILKEQRTAFFPDGSILNYGATYGPD